MKQIGVRDMQELARSQWKERATPNGLFPREKILIKSNKRIMKYPPAFLKIYAHRV